MKIKNLDAIVSEDKQIIIGGNTYTFPGDLPVSIMFRLMEGAGRLEKNPSDPEEMERSFRLIYDVVTIRDKKVDFETFKNSMTMKQYTELSNFVFNITTDEKKSGEESSDVKAE
jgi:hypothetical protein